MIIFTQNIKVVDQYENELNIKKNFINLLALGIRIIKSSFFNMRIIKSLF